MIKMPKNKLALSGMTVLIVGLALLIFTFINAYVFLIEALPVASSDDLVETFGGAISPLIATAMRVMYLGVMGWIGSIVTIRGINVISTHPKADGTQQKAQTTEPQ